VAALPTPRPRHRRPKVALLSTSTQSGDKDSVLPGGGVYDLDRMFGAAKIVGPVLQSSSTCFVVTLFDLLCDCAATPLCGGRRKCSTTF
jgi:hypothetical protein